MQRDLQSSRETFVSLTRLIVVAVPLLETYAAWWLSILRTKVCYIVAQTWLRPGLELIFR